MKTKGIILGLVCTIASCLIIFVCKEKNGRETVFEENLSVLAREDWFDLTKCYFLGIDDWKEAYLCHVFGPYVGQCTYTTYFCVDENNTSRCYR